MTEDIFRFAQNDQLGRVAAVDTTRVYIAVDEHSLLTKTGVGHLVAVNGQTALDHLIAVVERVIRRHGFVAVTEEEGSEVSDESEGVPEEDLVRAVIVGTYRAADGSQKSVFKRGADSFPQIDSACHVVCGENLQRLMNLLGSNIPEAQRLALGRFVLDRTALAVADGNRFFQRHAAILGSTGSGKSWAVALLLERASALAHANLIVLDMHGEYRPLAAEPEGFAQWFRVAGPGDLERPSGSTLFLPYWTLNREELLAMLLDRSDTNAPNQAHRFTLHVRALKEKTLQQANKPDVLATFTVDSPVHFSLAELLAALDGDNEQMVPGAKGEKQGEWHGKLTRFISRLRSKTDDRRYGFLFRPPPESSEYDWLAAMAVRLLGASGDVPGIKVVDFSEVPSDVLPVVVGVFARLLYEVQFWMEPELRTPLCLVCDEAHLYLPTADAADVVAQRALDSFERIAKEGRKYGVGLVVVSQRPSDVSRTILSQCNNFLALRLSNADDQAVVKKLLPDSLGGVMDALPLMDVGEAFIVGDAVLLPSRVKLDPPGVKPSSATREFWSEWAEGAADAGAIVKAVEALRRQSRG